MRSNFPALVGAAAICWVSAGAAPAQDWPQRPIAMVVSAAAGGPIDVFGRVLAERMTQSLGQRVLVENVAGGGGQVGGLRVARAEPDGYTILLGTPATHTYSQLLTKKPQYDAVADFTPVALIAELPLVLIARKDLPVDSVEDFVAYAKANQAKMNFGSAGAGSASHLGCILLNAAMGTAIQHVPYRGTGPAMQDLQAGRLDFLCEIIVTAVPQIAGGKVKGLAALSRDRAPVLASLPTAYEKGLANVQAYSWTAIFLPKGAPPAIVAKLQAAAVEAMDSPEVRKQLEALGSIIVAKDRRSPAYLGGFVKSELEKWAEPVRSSGAVAD